MSLSDRLAAAAKDRTGGTRADTGLKPAPTAPPREPTFILGAHMPVSAVEPDPTADPDSICPTCGRTGELGLVDLHRRTADWSCGVCGAMWRLTLPPHAPTSFP